MERTDRRECQPLPAQRSLQVHSERKRCGFCLGKQLQVTRRNAEDMARRACRREDLVEIEEPGIEERNRRDLVRNRGDAADGEACHFADEGRSRGAGGGTEMGDLILE